MFMIIAKQIYEEDDLRVRERREKTGLEEVWWTKMRKNENLAFCGGAAKIQETQNMIHDSLSAARNNNKNKKKVIRSMPCRVSSNSLKSQQVCYILHPCAEALFAFVTRDDG